MNELMMQWWESKTVQEQADLESSFAIIATSLATIIPMLIIASI